jgi:CDP-diacylglycerol--glycerol-3-phosphate 3-phosphatidyltransferase
MVYGKRPGIVIAFVILLAFVSDILDGVVARRLRVATARLRHLDSRVDLVFYATAAWAVWKLHPAVVKTVAIPALIVVALDVTRHVFDFLKFGRDVAYHAWSSKVWGLFLATSLMLLTGFGMAQPFVWLAVISGLIAQVEGLVISVILPRWTHDVPSFLHALKIRNNTRGQG